MALFIRVRVSVIVMICTRNIACNGNYLPGLLYYRLFYHMNTITVVYTSATTKASATMKEPIFFIASLVHRTELAAACADQFYY
jgi:hypothetical protein